MDKKRTKDWSVFLQISWREAMEIGLGVLVLTPDVFWAMTPKEFVAAMPIGIVTARCGAPFFLWLILKNRVFADD